MKKYFEHDLDFKGHNKNIAMHLESLAISHSTFLRNPGQTVELVCVLKKTSGWALKQSDTCIVKMAEDVLFVMCISTKPH